MLLQTMHLDFISHVCVQLGIKRPLPKRIKIDHFWQDIVFENIPTFYIVYGRLGHKDMQCSETAISENQTSTPQEIHCWWRNPIVGTLPGKGCQQKKTRPCDMTKESNSRPAPTKISSLPKVNIIILSSNGFQPLQAVNLVELDTF